MKLTSQRIGLTKPQTSTSMKSRFYSGFRNTSLVGLRRPCAQFSRPSTLASSSSSLQHTSSLYPAPAPSLSLPKLPQTHTHTPGHIRHFGAISGSFQFNHDDTIFHLSSGFGGNMSEITPSAVNESSMHTRGSDDNPEDSFSVATAGTTSLRPGGGKNL